MIIFIHNKLIMDKQTHNLLINVDNLTRGFGDTPELLFDRFKFSLYK